MMPGSRLKLASTFVLIGAGLLVKCDDSSEVFFPGQNFGPKPIEPCRQNAVFCEDAPDYPLGQSDIVLKSGFSNGFSDFEFQQESRACDSRKSIVYPKKAMNVDGKYRFILNDQSYKQAVEVEQCIGEGRPCRVDSDAPDPNTTVCRQKYTPYKMLAFDSQQKEFREFFSLPSACLCYSTNSPLGLRTGTNSDRQLPQCSSPAASRSTTTTFTRRPGRVLFEDKRRKKRQLIPNSCSESGAGTYCTSGDYPADVVLAAVRNSPYTEIEIDKLLKSCVESDIGVRRFSLSEKPLCEGIRKTIQPKKALNLANEWKFVVNVANYTQYVDIEECDPSRLENSQVTDLDEQKFGSCRYWDSEGRDPESTTCRQIFSIHKLVSLSSNGAIQLDSFKLPIACDCFLREDYQLTFRIG